MPNVVNTQIAEARETFQTLLELSRLLCTGLDPETLTICVRLCECGVNPEALASIVNELRREIAYIDQSKNEIQE